MLQRHTAKLTQEVTLIPLTAEAIAAIGRALSNHTLIPLTAEAIAAIGRALSNHN